MSDLLGLGASSAAEGSAAGGMSLGEGAMTAAPTSGLSTGGGSTAMLGGMDAIPPSAWQNFSAGFMGQDRPIDPNPPEHLSGLSQKLFNMMQQKTDSYSIGGTIRDLMSGQGHQLPQAQPQQMSTGNMLGMNPQTQQIIQMLMSQGG